MLSPSEDEEDEIFSEGRVLELFFDFLWWVLLEEIVLRAKSVDEDIVLFFG
jgi:hypothetical protein